MAFFFYLFQVFPDWFSENTQQYWTEALVNWSKSGVEFAGIWLDMNVGVLTSLMALQKYLSLWHG
jgi:hypothetical protein